MNLSTDQTIAQIKGKVSKIGDKYIVSGTIDTTIKLVCGRCLEEKDYALFSDLFVEFSQDPAYVSENEEVKLIKGTTIDLTDNILEEVILELPTSFVCSEECLGICKVCGGNGNITNCECSQSVVDLRLEQFKDFFAN